jgi:hypothetical protein
VTKFIALLLALQSIGCAGTLKHKTWRNMAVAGAAGAVIGSQQPSFKQTQSLLFAGVFASLAAAASLAFYESEGSVDAMKAENVRLKEELDEAFAPKLEAIAPGTMSGKVPQKYQRLISPGEWRVLQIDEWVEDGENRIIHQDKVMELIPPSLRPISLPTKKER